MRRTVPIILIAAFGVLAAPSVSFRAGAQEKPTFRRAPDALERVTWRTRTLVSDDRLTNWDFAVPATGTTAPTFLDAVVRVDAAVVNGIEGSSAQKVSASVQKNLDANLSATEISDLRARMGQVRMLTYRVDALPAEAQQPTLQFAKAMGADTVVVPAATALDGLDTLADQIGVNVAILSDSSKQVAALVKQLDGKTKRLGIGVDTGIWIQDGMAPSDAIAGVKDRLLYLRLRDRSGRGAGAKNVPLGEGAGKLTDLFHTLNRLNVRPLAVTLDTTDIVKAPADLFKAVDAFERVVQPAYGENFTAFSKTRPIRWDLYTPGRDEKLPPAEIEKRSTEAKDKIQAAIPQQAYAKPKKARRLLVMESLHGMSHNTIPHANVMLQLMGKTTGAWEAVFDNDLNNLKYPKIKEYDGVFLNSVVGEMLAEPAVREGLSRFVREGGGLGGVHGTPWASRNWEEFAEMIGSQSAPHRIENGIMQVYDASSPLMKPFGGKPLPFREEYYRFEHEGMGRLRWDKVRVLLTVDLDDPKIEPRPWNGYKRPDNIYPVTWIRTYGKGRVFYCSLGHMPETFMSREIVGHFLAGVQFLLGDLEANTTPNPRPGGTRTQ
jgi:type 1 glutamine amidotransferase